MIYPVDCAGDGTDHESSETRPQDL
jgi:hypothetical protein